MNVKRGDTLFLRCRQTNNVQICASVEHVTDDMITCDVLNGGWTLDIIRAKPPKDAINYNDAILWAEEHFKALPE